MGLVIGVLAALIVIFLLGYTIVKKPFFGAVLVSISLLVILFSIFFYFQKDDRIEKQKQRIPVTQIELSDINYGLAYGSYYKLTAKIKNHSTRYRLQAVFLQIAFFQCNEAEENIKNCQLLEKKTHKVETRLAPEQSAKIETYLLLDDVALLRNEELQHKGSLRWQVKIASGMAR